MPAVQLLAAPLNTAALDTPPPEAVFAVLLRTMSDQILDTLDAGCYRKSAPTLPEGIEVLQGRRITMVDDDVVVFGVWVPTLLAATCGTASFVRYQDESPQEITARILETQPEIVLLDWTLPCCMNGGIICQEIRAGAPDVLCIGFSSNLEAPRYFERYGAHATVDKDLFDREASLLQLSRCLERIKTERALTPR